jgi:membrane protease YdiL (CAAX protease family)
VIFGVSHGYQGLRNVITITIFGFLFGTLALWRKSLKPGMILHAWTDIFSGIFSRR